MKAYLGLSTEGNFKNGCMQDIHWTDAKGKMSTTKTYNYKNGCMQDIHWTDGNRTLITKRQLTEKKGKRANNYNYRDGCMQDIHWCDGSFGYFPSYTLGAMYAAQFMAAMRKTIDVDDAIRSGNLSPIFAWLSKNIWSKGSLLTTDELVKAATGEVLNPEHFKNHLKSRYLG
ncbi:hypothetical protein P5E67_02770, partial [Vibrio parahaemolyticus]|nr:hypothetical protein [Vibrio parahaemolyticus]